MPLYKLPIGIRIPKDDEYPKGHDIKSINDKRDSANIVEGFTISEVSGERFSHYAEANIDASKIWGVFRSLTNNLINESAYGIIGFKEEKSKLSRFTTMEKIIGIFQRFEFELTNDGFLEFGIATYNERSLNEIFVTSFKYMNIWTDKKECLVETFKSHGIQQMENLQFIDEFPVVTEALAGSSIKGITHYSEVIESIEREFDKL
jgi:hypothetical protein